MNRIARFVRCQRERCRLTEGQLSNRTHRRVSEMTIKLIESGTYHEPPVTVLKRIATAVRVSPVEMLIQAGYLTTSQLRAYRAATRRARYRGIAP